MRGMKHPAPASACARAWLIIRMTRPAFLLLTVVACVLGTATAAACGCGLDPGLALTAGVLAVLAHAAGNVINDLHDARNGADAANLQPMTPFAGGSRLIQQGLVSERQTAEVAWGLMLLVALGGLWLAVKTGGGLMPLGLAGLGLAWAYSAPPLKLMSRGLGELAVGLVWFLVVIGADYVQRRQFFLIPASAAASFALLTMAVLLINSLPDAFSDAQVGKHTTAVRLGADGSCVLYVLFVLLADVISRVTGQNYWYGELGAQFLPPFSEGHLLGTDTNGRDVLVRLAYGGRVSLLVAVRRRLTASMITSHGGGPASAGT